MNAGPMMRNLLPAAAVVLLAAIASPAMSIASPAMAADFKPQTFFARHCLDCHAGSQAEAGLDLAALPIDWANAENFARWVKIHDRLAAGEMPPQDSPRPAANELASVVSGLKSQLIQAEQVRLRQQPRTGIRRLTRAEYENTLRDLFDMPGLAVQGGLPADGSAHGFDKNADALDISHVNMARYVEAADLALDLAIATQPEPPPLEKQRISLASQYIVRLILFNGDAVLLKDGQPDPDFPPSGEHKHIDPTAHARMGSFNEQSSVGIFRHEDESFRPTFQAFAALYPGQYRVRASFWSFQWDKGRVLPARGVEAARLSAVQLTENGRGGGHPSYVLGYFDAPPNKPRVHEFVTWLNRKETFGFNASSLAPVVNYTRQGRAMAFTGPGIACDYLEVEGPLHDIWPPASHRLLFGELPLEEFKAAEHPNMQGPRRTPLKQEIISATNRPVPVAGLWTVHSEDPLADAERLLTAFLPKAFRRPVDNEVRQAYVQLVAERLQAGDCFELAMRYAYRAALCSPDFLYHVEPAGQLDDHALACRLSYFFWNSLPDQELIDLANGGKLRAPEELKAQVERMLKHPKSDRFIEDFLGQWLKLRQIAANDPDRQLYPEFSPYLQDSMVAETRAYFRELIRENLTASHLVKSNFAMLNEKLARHYGIDGVSGSQVRRVELPADHPRGPFLTQAAILKVTANGTTTSPVPRGAFVMARLLGQEPDPPPPNTPAIEPDVRGAKTIREQLDLHRNQTVCAGCHAKLDPPGFALEAFDVIGGWRERYRSIGDGEPAPRGNIDPFISVRFKLGPAVDSSGVLPDGRQFADIRKFQSILATEQPLLLANLAEQLTVYSTGHAVMFGERDAIANLVAKTQKQGGGIRALIHELVQSAIFQTK